MDKETLADVFLKASLVDKDERQFLLDANRKNPHESLEDTLVRLKFADEESVAKVIAKHSGVTYVDLSTPPDPKVLALIPVTLASQYFLFPIRIEDGALLLAMKDPGNMEAQELAQFSAGMPVRPCLAAPASLEKAIMAHYHIEENINDYMRNVPDNKKAIEIIADERMQETDVKDLRRKSESAPVIQMVNSLLFQGIAKGASDIHVEPQDKVLMVRNRVDGILTEAIQIPKWVQPALTSRLKIMAEMDIAEKRIPQDGRIKIKVEGKTLDLRISTLPTQHGEKIVIRVLNGDKSAPEIGGIGFRPDLIPPIREIITQPQGMLLVCGPTGSGKTTTLYGLLSEIAKRKINVVTLEDPIEYTLEGVNQVQVSEKSGLTFAKSLRSVLRQDPNVVFVGEIRDGETAEIALRAAMTGHLVLSTLHTNDAAATITRLLDLKIEPYLLASSLSAVMAQRLVRSICPDCREEHEPSAAVIRKVEEARGEEISFAFYRGKGCEKCGGTGYKGRMGVHELLVITPEIREIIRTQGASEALIRRAARKDSFRSLLEDALEKMKMGLTSVEEVERVVVFQSQDLKEPDEQKTVAPVIVPMALSTAAFAPRMPAPPAPPVMAPPPVTFIPPAQPVTAPPPVTVVPPAQPVMAPPPMTFIPPAQPVTAPSPVKHIPPAPPVTAPPPVTVVPPAPTSPPQSSRPPAAAATPPALLPLPSLGAVPSASAAKRSPDDFTGFKILIADDDEDTVRGLALYLLKLKFAVAVAANGREALVAMARDKPHILLTDVLMPEMDGLELVRQIRRDVSTTFTPVIIFSQKGDVEDRLKGFEAGSDDYLPKPFEPAELLQRIKAVLRRAYA